MSLPVHYRYFANWKSRLFQSQIVSPRKGCVEKACGQIVTKELGREMGKI